MEPWELAAREEIRELVATYTHLGDGGRVSEVGELFAPDGVLELAGRGAHEGPDAVAAALGEIASGHSEGSTRTYMRHHVSNLTISFAGPDDASGSAYWLVIDDAGLMSWGRYRDAYRRGSDGRWRFARRYVRGDPRID